MNCVFGCRATGKDPLIGRVQALRFGRTNFGEDWCIGELEALETSEIAALAVAGDVVSRDDAGSLPRKAMIRRLCEAAEPQEWVFFVGVHDGVEAVFVFRDALIAIESTDRDDA